MDEKEKKNKVEESFVKNKLSKYGATKKTGYSILGLGGCLILIIALSLVNAIFNPDALTTVAFWIDYVILVFISIYSMTTGQGIGDDTGRNNEKGVFRQALIKFKNIFDLIDGKKYFTYFADWLEIYRMRKLRRKIEATIKDEGVYQLEVLDLDQSELDNLKKPWKKDWKNSLWYKKYYNEETKESITYFLSYTDEQIEVIRYCLKGKVKVSRIPESFFMSALDQDATDKWESAAHSGRKKNAYMSTTYLYRLLSMLAMCVIFAGLEPALKSGVGAATILMKLAIRIFTMITSVVWGIFIGLALVKIDVDYINFKVDILTLYYNEEDSGMYKHESITARAEREYKELEELRKRKFEELVKKEGLEDVEKTPDESPSEIIGEVQEETVEEV